MAKLTPEQALRGTKVFYAKKWQQNGFYPIDKFVYAERRGWEEFVWKGKGWHSWGIAYEKPCVLSDKTITNYSWWKYIFENNKYILSDEEMKNDHKFNLE